MKPTPLTPPADVSQTDIKIVVTLPTTSDLFKKHFTNVYGEVGAGLFHPNMEAFLNDLNDVCIIEDLLKQILNHERNKNYL